MEINRDAIGYSNWWDNQPASDGGSNEDCAAMIFSIPVAKLFDPAGHWHDVSCDVTGDAWAEGGLGFVCKIPDGRDPPAVRGPAAIGLDMFTYQYFMEPLAWQQANANCVQQGGTLADLSSAAEESFVKATVMEGSNQTVWLGCNDVDAEGTWEWPDKTTCAASRDGAYTNWAQGEPNQYRGNNEDCAAAIWKLGTCV